MYCLFHRAAHQRPAEGGPSRHPRSRSKRSSPGLCRFRRQRSRKSPDAAPGVGGRPAGPASLGSAPRTVRGVSAARTVSLHVAGSPRENGAACAAPRSRLRSGYFCIQGSTIVDAREGTTWSGTRSNAAPVRRTGFFVDSGQTGWAVFVRGLQVGDEAAYYALCLAGKRVRFERSLPEEKRLLVRREMFRR